MKKKIMMALLAGCLSAAACAMTYAGEETEAVTEVTEEAEGSAEIAELGERPTYKALDYVTVDTYKGLPVEVDEIVITEDMITAAIKEEAANAGLYETLSEGIVETGDIANIDYEGKKDGVAFDGGTAQGFDLTIGSHMFIDGFEDGLIGVKSGETVDLNLTFPEYYGNADLAGADVVFTVTVNSIQRLPEITDELIKELTTGAYTTVEAYSEHEKEELTKQAEEAQEAQISNDLMTQLYNLITINDYPQDVVDYSIADMNNYYMEYAQAYGMEFDEFLTTYFGMDRAAYDEEAAEIIKTSIQQEMILMAVAESEGLDQISDEDYKEGLTSYAARLGFESEEALLENYGEGMVRLSLAMDKAMEFVRSEAIVSVIPAEQETEAVSEEAEEMTE